MLTDDEVRFMSWWEANRERKKKWTNQLTVGLPLATVLVVAIFVNFFSGWYKRAEMMANTDTSLIIILLIAAAGIVLFITIFSVRHKWEMYEQQYRELLNRRQKPNDEAAESFS